MNMNRTHKSKSVLAAVVMLVLLVAGCKGNTQSSTLGQKDSPKESQSAMQQAANDIKQSTATAGAAIGDAAIIAKVKAAIIAEPALSSSDIKVDTVDGVVTLSGTADTPQDLERAAQLAQTVDGVKTVNNQLNVKAPS
jgi:hyperosmotically inducible periplasmic protein